MFEVAVCVAGFWLLLLLFVLLLVSVAGLLFAVEELELLLLLSFEFELELPDELLPELNGGVVTVVVCCFNGA